ncbi:CLN3 protein [Ancylostoma caninum]|uniref:Battenin n=1 Tax=Ancylostoma caninum TaxID=29170 RepID=A0A368FK05_ANCCA|nr:CLN3 protein [Ancylostoma caninum]
MAGVVGAFSYAGLTDRHLLALSPAEAMMVMLVVPALFMFTFHFLLEHTDTMKRISFSKKSSDSEKSTSEYGEKLPKSLSIASVDSVEMEKTIAQRLTIVKLELTVFDCSHGYGTSPASQYRWYQVLYQVGVFVSRSSINCIQLNMLFIALMPVFQVRKLDTIKPLCIDPMSSRPKQLTVKLINTAFFLLNAIYAFLPNFGIVCAIVLYEGLIGGGSYVNTFHHIHKKVDPSIREFALSTVSLADSIGIMLAAFVSIPIHNAICEMQWYR